MAALLGIRAQIQHLKAYTSTDALANICIDLRFKYVTRGSSSYVEWLDSKENPKGVGWLLSCCFSSCYNLLKTGVCQQLTVRHLLCYCTVLIQFLTSFIQEGFICSIDIQ